MKHKIFQVLDQTFQFETASAHCDIPCKIYDPSGAQIAALSVIRFIDIIQELGEKDSLSLSDQAQISRLVREKEIHAALVKSEINTIWGDYFKAPQFEKFPQTNELVHKIMMAGSASKQNIDREKALELLNLVNEFADIFWQTKGVETTTATCPYPPSEKVVYPVLS